LQMPFPASRRRFPGFARAIPGSQPARPARLYRRPAHPRHFSSGSVVPDRGGGCPCTGAPIRFISSLHLHRTDAHWGPGTRPMGRARRSARAAAASARPGLGKRGQSRRARSEAPCLMRGEYPPAQRRGRNGGGMNRPSCKWVAPLCAALLLAARAVLPL